MSVSFVRRAAVFTGVVAVAGTLAGTAPAAAASSTSPVSVAASKVVARVDVDGDGRADTVTMTPSKVRGEKGNVLKVVTARGKTASVTYATPFLYSATSWFGAARLDGVTGHELVVRTGYGAHTQYFAVYSWRGGKLAAQKEPGTGRSQWFTDGAWSIGRGFTSGVVGGRKTLTVREYDRIDGGAYFRGTADTYTWRSGGWKKTATSTVRAHESSPKVGHAYGWHVAGLPR